MAKIVFCEDHELIKKFIQQVCCSMGHEIHFASDGREGLRLIERVHPDLIFSDIAMPNCDGLQLIDALKARPHLAAIPVIFITAFSQKYDREECIRHGAAEYITKPFTMIDLKDAITNTLASHQNIDVEEQLQE